MKNMKKIKWCKVIYQFRHCLAFMTIIIICFAYCIDSYAENVDIRFTTSPNSTLTNGGTVNYVSTYSQFYSDSDYTSSNIPVLFWDGAINKYNFDGFDSSKITTPRDSTLFVNGNDSSSVTSVKNGFFNSDNNFLFKYVTSIEVPNNGLNVNFPSNSYCLDYYSYINPWGYSGFDYYYSVRFTGNGRFCIIGQYVVSDMPFDYFMITYPMGASNNCRYYRCNDVSANGYYCYSVDGFGASAMAGFCNCPMYLPSSDGESGFTTFSLTSTDFDFDGNNYDFNTLLTGGVVINPNAPEPEVESDAKYHLTFRDNTYYSGSGLNMFWHNNNFTFTEYQINNPTYYRLRFSYRVEFQNNLGVNDTYYYTPSSDVQLAYFLGQANRLNTGSRISVPLCSNWFVNGNGQTLTQAIIGTINAVTGTYVEDINPNGLFENAIDWLVGAEQYFFGGGDTSPLQVVRNRYDGTITKFKIYGEVSLYNDVNSNYESNSYIDSHDFLDGNTEIVSTDNTISPYDESPVPVYEQLPSSSSSGISAGANSAIATIEKGAVSIQVNAGNGSGGGFQMPQQDWNEFGGLITEMRTDLTTLTSDNGVLSVMGAVQKVTSGILPTDGGGTPNKLWYLIYAGVAGSIAIALWNKAAHNH